MNKEFKLGIVGLGGIARQAHGPAIQKSDAGIKLSAVCDVNKEAVDSYVTTFGGTGYTDFDEMLSKENLDGIVIATWPIFHREQIEKVLNAGVKNILCEKALVMTREEALAIHELTAKTGSFIMEGFMYRHNPVIRKLEQILSFGHLGAVDNVRACFNAVADQTRPHWLFRKESGGGVAHDRTCYPINFCGHIAGGLPTRVYCAGAFGSSGTMNQMHGTIEYENGVVGILESSLNCGFSQEVQISCKNGILNLPLAWTIRQNIPITQRHADWNSLVYDTFIAEPDAYKTAHQLQLENFVASARGEAKPVIPLVESIVNTFTLGACVKSVEEKRAVDIEIPESIQNEYRRLVKPLITKEA